MSKDQYVIACVETPADAAIVIPWARHFAERLRHKGLMVLHVKRHAGDAPQWLKELAIPYASLTGDWHTAIEGLPTAFNGILAVAAVNPAAPRTALANPRTLLRQFRSCKIAYLCVHSPLVNTPPAFSTALTLTHRREGKEKLVWASYLARFLGSRLLLSHPDYRDEDLRRRWSNNMRFVEKMFNPQNITYTTPTLSRLTRVDQAALDELHPDLLIAITSDPRERDLFDLLQPLPEFRLLTHSSRTPLIFLNPRDDLYILCD